MYKIHTRTVRPPPSPDSRSSSSPPPPRTRRPGYEASFRLNFPGNVLLIPKRSRHWLYHCASLLLTALNGGQLTFGGEALLVQSRGNIWPGKGHGGDYPGESGEFAWD